MKGPLALALLLAAGAASAQAPEAGKKVAVTFVDVDACWARPVDPRADILGLPEKFCVSRVGLINPNPGSLPFSEGSALVIEGRPASGSVHISGGSREKDHWNIVGDLWNGREDKPKCGKLNVAFAAIYVDVGLQGELLAKQNPVVRGFLMDGSAQCRGEAPSVEILYTRLPN